MRRHRKQSCRGATNGRLLGHRSTTARTPSSGVSRPGRRGRSSAAVGQRRARTTITSADVAVAQHVLKDQLLDLAHPGIRRSGMLDSRIDGFHGRIGFLAIAAI